MKNIESLIVKNKMILPGETVGVAVSGGSDSMCLLHLLNVLKDKLNFEVVAINVDHNLRENSANDSAFVKNYCEKQGIRLYAYSIDVNKICEDKHLTIEQGAREARYKTFKKLLDKGIVNKIALGHHMQDQTETILLNIFRGTGLSGACGMELIRDGVYIRPLLKTSKAEIKAYLTYNEIPFVEDETNLQNDYARNYIRNMIMPMIRTKWSNADSTIAKFGEICREDNDYIFEQIDDRAILFEREGVVKIATSYFTKSNSIVFRLILKALKVINASTNVDRKHLKMIKDMTLESENGTKISLPNGVSVIKEYNFITFTNKKIKPKQRVWKMAKGVYDIPNIGVLEIIQTRKLNIEEYHNLVDAKKLPKNGVWRFKKDGDTFTKFGGGTKSLNEFLIDKKVPQRLRNFIPVFAVDDEILIVAGLEISKKVKVDEDTKTAYGINLVKF